MKAHLIDTHLLVPGSGSSAKVKVKYLGHIKKKKKKKDCFGALVFHKHILICHIFQCFVNLEVRQFLIT